MCYKKKKKRESTRYRGKVHNVKCCKCMSPATVCIKCFGSTQNLISSLAKEETLRRAVDKHMRFGQEMVCKVADVYILFHPETCWTYFFFFSLALNLIRPSLYKWNEANNPSKWLQLFRGRIFTKDMRIKATTMRPFIRGSFNEQEACVYAHAHTHHRAPIVTPKTNIKLQSLRFSLILQDALDLFYPTPWLSTAIQNPRTLETRFD